jgi:hypothetical protein
MRSIVQCKSGEGRYYFERPYPLTPTRSPWERERTFIAVIVQPDFITL